MKAAVIVSPRVVEIHSAPLPEAGEEEVLVKMKGTGLCASNLPVWEGREWFSYPIEAGAPGHEGYGFVVNAGAKVTGIAVGDKVSLISHHAYAEYDKAHFTNVVKIPDTINRNPFPGEPLACAVNVFNRSDISAGQTVVIIGAGFLGCLLIQLAKSRGARIIAVSRRKSSLEFAAKAGADHLIRFSDRDEAARQVYKINGGEVSRVIEATGEQTSVDLATEIIAEGGRLIIAGYHQDGLRTINMQVWNWKGIDVINAHERDPRKYTQGLREAVKKTAENILRPGDLITHFYDYTELNQAFQVLYNRPEGFLKAVITYS